MIALIALIAMAVIVGAAIGVFALLIAIVKAIMHARRRPSQSDSTAPPTDPAACSSEEDQEFRRIMEQEWPLP